MGNSEEELGVSFAFEGNGTITITRQKLYNTLLLKRVTREVKPSGIKSKIKTQNSLTSTASDGCSTLHTKPRSSGA